MEVKTVQEIFLILDIATLVHALFMETGQPGLNGANVARHVQMEQDLASERAATLFHSSVAKIVLEN